MNPVQLSVFSPLKGEIVPLSQVPDPAFAEKVLGEGIAINPQENIVRSPIEGRVKIVNKFNHAVVVERDGLEIMVHIGIESVELAGAGFSLLVKKGDRVNIGTPIIEFDRNFVGRKAKSNLIIVLATNSHGMDFEFTDATAVENSEFLFSIESNAETEKTLGEITIPNLDTILTSDKIEILNPNGLHARPAAMIANMASKSKAKLTLIKNGIGVDAKSLVAIMGLNIFPGDTIQVSAHGTDAAAALSEMTTLVKLYLNTKNPVFSTNEGGKDFSAGLDMESEQPIPVHTIYRGKTYGPAFVLEGEEPVFPENASDAERELDNFKKAVHETERAFMGEILKAQNKDERTILQSHVALLKDPLIRDRALAMITRHGKSAPYAFSAAIDASIEALAKTKNIIFVEKIADLKDIRKTLINRLLGRVENVEIPRGCVLVAEDLLPSDMKKLNGVRGVVLARGSHTSHTAILLKNLGLPTVYGAGMGILDIGNGHTVLVDADRMFVVANPSSQALEEFRVAIQRADEQRKTFMAQAMEPAVTLDGHRIFIRGNIGSGSAAKEAAGNGAEGLGLVRTEFLFLNRAAAPTEEEQIAVYQQIVTDSELNPVCFRTLDIGGDKPAIYAKIPSEQNPLLGVRGVRIYAANEELFRTQVRALLKVRPLAQVNIMIPMVAFAEEVIKVRAIIEEEKEALNIRENVSVGIMLEVPSACIMSGTLAKYADFFSIGTNDLTQYTLAIDREHPALSNRAEALHPAVLRLLSLAVAGAADSKTPISVCGALASEDTALPILIGLGITELAVVTGEVAEIKALVRKLDFQKCAETAAKAMLLETSEQVEELVKTEFNI